MNLIEYLELPKDAKTRRKIPIKEIISALDDNINQRKILISAIEHIYLFGVIDYETTGLRPYVDEVVSYESIYIFQVDLKNNQSFTKLDEILQGIFPNPAILFYVYNNNHLISSAFKRINKANKEKSVVESSYLTNWFVLDEDHKELMKIMSRNFKENIDLKNIYENIADTIYSERLIDILDFYPIKKINNFQLRANIQLIENAKSKIKALNEDLKKVHMMSKKIGIYDSIKQKQLIIEAIKKKILEVNIK